MAPRSGNSRIWRSDPGIPGSGALGSGNPGSGSRILEFPDLGAGSWNSRIWRPGIGNSRIWRPGVGKSRILAPRAGIPDLAPGRLGEAAGAPVSLGNPPACAKCAPREAISLGNLRPGAKFVFFLVLRVPRAHRKNALFCTVFLTRDPYLLISPLIFGRRVKQAS